MPRKNRTNYICSNCKKGFTKLNKRKCQNCSKALTMTVDFCEDCCYWKQIYRENTLKNISLYRYNEAFHDLMVKYKRYGDYELRLILQTLLEKIPQADLYVPIPSSNSHLKERGYDTIKSIYKDIVKLEDLLENNDLETPQGEKNKQERLATKQSFMVKEKYAYKTEPKTILLLDDIYTTGRTLYHARDAISKIFCNSKIQSFTIAR